MRLPLHTALLAAFLALVLPGCATNGIGPVRAGTYTLLPGQSVEVARNAILTYESYSDSRCPVNMRCIWAGELLLHMELEGDAKQEVFQLGPNRPAWQSPLLRHARIAFGMKGGIPRIPRAGMPAPASDYAIVISVAPQ